MSPLGKMAAQGAESNGKFSGREKQIIETLEMIVRGEKNSQVFL